MDFGFNEQQREVQGLARQILSQEVTPEKLAAYDEYKAERFDRALWGQLAEAGLLGVTVAEEFGGMGFGFTELCLLLEEIGRTIAPLPALPTLAGGALALQRFGDAAQQRQWLPAVTAGTAVLTVALAEQQNPDIARPLLARARPDGDGFVLDGSKAQVAFARQAASIVVSAATDAGPVLLLVDPQAAGVELQDLRVTTFEPQCSLVFRGVQIPPQSVLAGPEQGALAVSWLAQRQQAALCAMQLGAADFALRLTATYTSERKQFGVPVATFQAVGHRAANGFIDVECLRLSTYQAVSLLDSETDATTEVLVAKCWAGDVGHRISYSAQHLHGGMGIDRDYKLWRYCLWLRHNEMSLGNTAGLQAVLGQRIAAGEAFCQ